MLYFSFVFWVGVGREERVGKGRQNQSKMGPKSIQNGVPGHPLGRLVGAFGGGGSGAPWGALGQGLAKGPRGTEFLGPTQGPLWDPSGCLWVTFGSILASLGQLFHVFFPTSIFHRFCDGFWMGFGKDFSSFLDT